MARSWDHQAGGARVAGGWCTSNTMRRIGAPMHGKYGTRDAEFEVLRTIKRAE